MCVEMFTYIYLYLFNMKVQKYLILWEKKTTQNVAYVDVQIRPERLLTLYNITIQDKQLRR